MSHETSPKRRPPLTNSQLLDQIADLCSAVLDSPISDDPTAGRRLADSLEEAKARSLKTGQAASDEYLQWLRQSDHS